MLIPGPDRSASDESQQRHVRARVPLAIEDWLTVCIMALLALLTFANVLVRYFTSISLAWTEEISIFLMILLAMVGTSAAVARQRHIRIGFFADRGPAQRQRRFAIFAAALVLLVFAAIAVLSARVTWDHWRYSETSPGLGLPEWLYSMWLPIVSVFIALRALGVIRRGGRPATEETRLPPPDAAGDGDMRS
ncbi:MAG: TRAP transporter small permease [Ottowia sp.]|nr:TRAP transporter small permease [Ottowia sp.]